MKIGDKVRFLNEVGEGRVSGFQGKDTVLVEDADGFDIPMLITDVVVIGDEEYDISRVNTGTHKPFGQAAAKGTQGSQQSGGDKKGGEGQRPVPVGEFDDADYDPSDRPVTFKAKPQERRGGELLNLYLAYLPVDVKMLTSTNFECYLVNDSNYFLDVVLMSAEGANWKARFQGTLEPNTKLFVEEFERSQLQDIERLCLQVIAYKREKSYALKPAYAVMLRTDSVKFYKLHLFQPNLFFNEPCLLVDVIRDDNAVKQVFVDAEELAQSLMEGKKPQEPVIPQKDQPAPSKPQSVKRPEVVEVDLHIEQLLDDLSGLSNGDMLLTQMKEFHRVMDENLSHKGMKIVFIHGKGEGVLRKSILQELKYRYKNCTWQDASFREYGFGATMVKIG